VVHRSVVGVHLLLFEGEQVLLGVRKNSGWRDGWWHAPAGHLEDGESVRGAMAREALEELSITVEPDHLDLVHTVHHLDADDGKGRIQLFFRPRSYEGTVRIAEPHKCARLSYWPVNALPPRLVEYTAVALSAYGRGETLSEVGWNT
jgi:8-oxo-dGTP diphosphatase